MLSNAFSRSAISLSLCLSVCLSVCPSAFLCLSEKFFDVGLLSSKYHIVDNGAKYLVSLALR